MVGNSSPPVIIVGMHRSGTSLVTELLGLMGVHTGDHMQYQFEADAFREVNSELLASIGCEWANPEPFLARLADPGFVERMAQDARRLLDQRAELFGVTPEGQPWGWKDPRTTITLPVWRAIYPGAKVLHVERSGLPVALSVQRRELSVLQRHASRGKVTGKRARRMIPPTLVRAYRLWEIYTRAALAEEPRWAAWLTIQYETLAARPVETLCQLRDFVGLSLPQPELEKLAAERIQTPRAPSSAERTRFRLLARLGLINTDLMAQLGYDRSGA